MDQRIEKSVVLRDVSIHLATLSWEGVEETPAYTGYSLSQRLSDNHSPLRIGNASAPQVLPRVGSVGLLPPGRSIHLFPVERPLRVLYCVFEEARFELATGVPRETWDAHVGSLVAMNNRRLEVLMQEIYAELEQPGFGGDRLIEAVGNMMLVELARYIRKIERAGAGETGRYVLAPWQMRRIEERIGVAPELGYPDLPELAELCGISKGHLMRSFKQSTGWQLHKFIAEERMKAARTMLAEGEITCREVAARLGFRSPAYFATAFRRSTGKTPTEYREQARISNS